jgi:hypothetical protein
MVAAYRNYLRRKFLREPGVVGIEYQWQALVSLGPLMLSGLAAWYFGLEASSLQLCVGLAGIVSLVLLGFVTLQWFAVKDHEFGKLMRREGYQKTKALDLTVNKDG